MSNFLSFNHKIISADNVSLSASSSAALYGKGIFTTVAIHEFVPFLWKRHWRRITNNARKIEIDLAGFSDENVLNSLQEIIEKNNLASGRARLTFFDESPASIWQTNQKKQTSLLIQTAEFRAVPEKFRLTVSPFCVNSTSPLIGVKSCNYLENILSLEDAKAKGFDEAIRLNEKQEVVSACLANIFWKKNNSIYTPALETGCLEGTTRSFVFENFSVTERKANLAELYEADEIFLTSAGIGIMNCEFEIT